MTERLGTEQIEAFWHGVGDKEITKILKGKRVVLVSAGPTTTLFDFISDKIYEHCELTSGDNARQNTALSTYRREMISADLIIVIPDKAGREMSGVPVTVAMNMMNQPTAWKYDDGGLPGTMAPPSQYGREKTIVLGVRDEVAEVFRSAKGGVVNILDLKSGKNFIEGVKRVLKK